LDKLTLIFEENHFIFLLEKFTQTDPLP